MNESSLTHTPVRVLNRSAFDKSHQNLLTSKVGTLTPVLVDELIPGSSFSLKSAVLAKLPPLASDTFMRVKLHLEAFFVPYRILYGGYGYAMSGQRATSGGAPVTMPRLSLSCGSASAFRAAFGPGTLCDYLGYKMPVSGIGNVYPDSNNPLKLNIFPFLAYHKIYDDWYRNALIQQPVFRPIAVGDNVMNNPLCRCLPYEYLTANGGDPAGPNSLTDFTAYVTYSSTTLVTTGSATVAGNVYLTDLRQRNFGMDYFTSATPSPTVGNIPFLYIASTGSADSSGNVSASANVSIGALRSVNSLTQFAERNALSGVKYNEWLKANYGSELSADTENRAQYLGRLVLDVYSKGVYQTTGGSNGTSSSRNPFTSVGSELGAAAASGEGTLCDNFEVREPGCLMVLASLVPKVSYSSGCSRLLSHYTAGGFRGDLANQMLENVGPQPIYNEELDGNLCFASNPTQYKSIFGYTDRYAEYKVMNDRVGGLMSDGGSLAAFAAQRSFLYTAIQNGINSAFIEIPVDYLDQVSAASTGISQYGYWLDSFFDYKVVQPLSRYSTPSLVMPAEHEQNGHTVTVKRASSHL